MDPTKKFVGYHDPASLPVKRGDFVTILKGTPVRTGFSKKNWKPAGRTYKVKIDHILPGCTTRPYSSEEPVHEFGPSIRWAGSGGYWYEADINDIPEAVK